MMIIIVMLVMLGAVTLWKAVDFKTDLADYLGGVIMGAVGGFLGLFLGLGLAWVIGTTLPSKYVLKSQIELVAMQDTANVQGSFFLGSGTIESKPYYVFYQKTGKGLKFGKIPVENVIVYEEKGRTDGLINVYAKRFTKDVYKLFAVVSGTRYEIFIPKGSILRDFKLDLK
jgi:hypothetical protein